MERFVHNENLKRFRELLAQENDLSKRKQIERLIGEEEARQVEPLEDGKPKD
jgi:hypothetical protein